ncbi:glycoside hydrolase family 19 protein [Pseudomonas helleri]|uniref:Glycoside hydrolase family 19 protein n=1 Tax=Pseudomonas helleri TaxID=1608996 RepID=A0A6G1WA85_9PSED|nr:glycoside hydrolase family 19 protein [Pseudomonas helleri]MQT27929.1 glycoside hydrolase family 19 protein [Pseudomonas helleri]MQU16349.1 glycoside hydrolase family 19 protein [Pseudomonas helleri]
MLNREMFITLFPKSAASVDVYLPIVQAVTLANNIDTPRRLAAFMAQVGHESAGFTTLIENLNYSADGLAATWGARFAQRTSAGQYITVMDGGRVRRLPNSDAQKLHRQPEAIANRVYSNRLGNGSEASGEGWLYRGRGLIQITGKSNYQHCSLGLYGDERLLETPQLLEQWPGAVASAGWYWSSRQLNARADGQDFEALTRAINGGLNGHVQRLAVFERALGLLS